MAMLKSVVLGIGNTLLSDDGVGIHALSTLRPLQHEFPNTEFIDGGTLSFSLAPILEGKDIMIVLDAAQIDQAPGTIATYVNQDLDNFLFRPAMQSVHEVGLSELFDILRLQGELPRYRALIGIQPYSLDWGEQPSAAVADSIPLVHHQVRALLRQWRA